MSDVMSWLLDADPALRWQVLRDLTDAPSEVVSAERSRVAVEGWGAQLLGAQSPDGTWGGAAWNRGWDSTMHVLTLLKDLGLDPEAPAARAAVARVRDQVTWRGCGPDECADNPFFAGEVEACINAQVAAAGAYFGQDVQGIVDRLLSEQLPDGGWNCEAPERSTRSSFNTTICVLEALLEYERSPAPRADVRDARRRGEDYLLERRLCRRRSTGERIARDRKGASVWTEFAFPVWWHYDVLRGLDYLRNAGATPDERVGEAIDVVQTRRRADGTWSLDLQHQGRMPIDLREVVGRPSRWLTLRCLRVVAWADGRASGLP